VLAGRRMNTIGISGRKVRFGCKLLFATLLLATSGAAVTSGAFREISWAPARIVSGSPCVFRVRMAVVPASLSGSWQRHELTFVPAGNYGVWYALAGVDVETRPGSYNLKLRATLANGTVVRQWRMVTVGRARFPTETLRVPDRYVEPDADTLVLIKANQQLKHAVFSHPIANAEWSGDFRAPIDSAVTEGFGTRRTFNGKLESIHRGIDYHAPPGTPVMAANSGEVVLARELFYEGNCVIIDHGLGFTTIYMHLSQLEVSEGQQVEKGQEIALSGATGRVTGPHLHIAVRWQGAYLDPAQLWALPLPDRHAVSVSTVKATR